MDNWNVVFNKVIEIKHKYQETFGNIAYEQTEGSTCLGIWLERLAIKEYLDLFQYLQINQKDRMLLVRYRNYADVFGGAENITADDFWQMHDGFYQECRSVVIDVELEIIVLSPFKKFKNLNEGAENQLEIIAEKIENAKLVEITNKLDGSMQSARFVPEYGRIIMSGSQAIDREQSWRLQDGFARLLADKDYTQMLEENPQNTFIFEYITLQDAHVVVYREGQEGLYLVGVRDVYTGRQASYKEVRETAQKYGVKCTEVFDKTFAEVMEDVKTKKSNEMEGYVLNIDGHLLKVKVDDYINIHKILSKISSINLIIKHIADDSYDDLIAKVPTAYQSRIDNVAQVIFDYLQDIDKRVNECFAKCPKESRKDFMLYVEQNAEKDIRAYVRNIYLGVPNNYLKSGNEKAPRYKKLKEMGIENYADVFVLDDQ
jgi:T4 RnlA family RNA ligase